MYIRRAISLAKNYIISPISGTNSTSTYWYLPDPPNITTNENLTQYKESKSSPFYVVDYRTRTDYRFDSDDGILRLPYDEPLGQQINPEAAFQCALGWHDRHVLEGSVAARGQFLNYASEFLSRQSLQGDFSYTFDWFENKAPWHSALAQSRGASVMLRAYLITEDQAYAASALRALQRFDVDCENGGYRAIFTPEGVPYFEEYPSQKNAVINGFMASLFALYELGHWLQDERCTALFVTGINSLEKMLPHYTLPWWTLYDRSEADLGKNVHSPRYQDMVVGYLHVLKVLSGSPIIGRYADHWEKLNTKKNRLRAYVAKAHRKLVYR